MYGDHQRQLTVNYVDRSLSIPNYHVGDIVLLNEARVTVNGDNATEPETLLLKTPNGPVDTFDRHWKRPVGE